MTTSSTTSNLYSTINNQAQWDQALLPFIKSTGLFIETSAHFNLSQGLDFKLNFMNGLEIINLTGIVVLVNPALVQDNFNQGIGIQVTTANWPMIKQKISQMFNDIDKE